MQRLAIMLTAVMAVAPVTAGAQVAGNTPAQTDSRQPDVRPLDPAVLRASMERLGRDMPATSNAVVRQTSRRDRPRGERLALVAIGTAVGFWAGAYIGYGIDRTIAPCRCETCDCDMVGFRGIVLGAPIGALAGLITSIAVTR